MLHRIRLAMQTRSFLKLGGNGNEVEVDETFIGGKARNMHVERARAPDHRHGRRQDCRFSAFLSAAAKFAPLSFRIAREACFTERFGSTLKPGAALYTDALQSYRRTVRGLRAPGH